MKVITGTARGRKLKEPTGQKIRPTSSLVKEAIFNIVQFDIEGRRVLDLFAGTGQLGIEALSRGAKSCDFVDFSKEGVALVQENLKSCKLEGGQVFLSDARSFVKRGGEYDLIFLDPPYGDENFGKLLEDIAQVDILSKNGIMVCETSLEEKLPELALPYEAGKSYRYGKVKVTVYTKR